MFTRADPHDDWDKNTPVIKKIVPHKNAAVRADGETVPMIRKNSSQGGLNAVIAKCAEGSKQLKALLWRDLQNTEFANEATSTEEIVKFDHAIEFFKNKPMDRLNKSLLTPASYNAGPGRIAQLRNLAEKQGLNHTV